METTKPDLLSKKQMEEITEVEEPLNVKKISYKDKKYLLEKTDRPQKVVFDYDKYLENKEKIIIGQMVDGVLYSLGGDKLNKRKKLKLLTEKQIEEITEVEEPLNVKKISYKGKKYLLEKTDRPQKVVFDYDEFLENKKKVIIGQLIDKVLYPLEEKVTKSTTTPSVENIDETTTPSVENIDENNGIYYLKIDDLFEYFWRDESPTGVQFSNSVIVNDGYKADGFINMPIAVNTNGIALVVTGFNTDVPVVIKFINKNNEIIQKGRTVTADSILGIYNPILGAFVGIFVYKKGYIALETYDRNIVNALKDIIFQKNEIKSKKKVIAKMKERRDIRRTKSKAEYYKKISDQKPKPLEQSAIEDNSNEIKISAIEDNSNEIKILTDEIAEITKQIKQNPRIMTDMKFVKNRAEKMKKLNLLISEKSVSDEPLEKEGSGIGPKVSLIENPKLYKEGLGLTEILEVSNPKLVEKNLKKYLGKDAKLFLSNRKNKKYAIQTPDGNLVHFGDIRYPDFTKHQDINRKNRYLARATKIKGNWKNDKYSPNSLSINLLWN